MVYLGWPYASTNRSFVIIIVSDDRRSLQLLPNTLSEFEATAMPRDKTGVSKTPPVPVPWTYQPAWHPPPNVYSRMPFQALLRVAKSGCGSRVSYGIAIW